MQATIGGKMYKLAMTFPTRRMREVGLRLSETARDVADTHDGIDESRVARLAIDCLVEAVHSGKAGGITHTEMRLMIAQYALLVKPVEVAE